jgi:peptidylprolyl isomerase
VIGHAPRHLDRNIATVGRVIEGIAFLSARSRGTGNLGFYDTARNETPIPIRALRLAADMPEAERPRFEVMRTDTGTFSAFVTGRANRGGTFFIRPAGGVDLCNVNVPVRRVTG